MSPRLLLVVMGWCFALVAWETFAYPPDYLLGAYLWGAMATIGSAFCVAAVLSPRREVSMVAGIACVCHAIGRASAVIIQILFRQKFGLGAPFANYAIAATTWTMVATLIFFTWSHFVIPWAVLQRADRGES